MAGTGSTILPDFGVLAYNGVTFSSLYSSEISGGVVQDEARRTTKYMEWTLQVDGRVTLNPGEVSTDATWANIRKKLSVHGAPLTYMGQGFGGMVVNFPGNPVWDVAFGPVPKVIFFQPLGQGRSAMIRWQVTCHLPEVVAQNILTGTPNPGSNNPIGNAAILLRPVLQYNYEATISYDDDDYSSVSIRGTLEIPMTRAGVDNRNLPTIVDRYRDSWMDMQIDLQRFRVVRRNFNYSRDKRTADFEFVYEELPPMGMPPGASNARGTMSVRPARYGGFGGAQVAALTGVAWSVSLRATYTIRPDWPPRVAAAAFYSLMWFRMWSSTLGERPAMIDPNNQQQQAVAPLLDTLLKGFEQGVVAGGFGRGATPYYDRLFAAIRARGPIQKSSKSACIIITDFGYDEGLYLDSKTITFEASWWLLTTFRSLLVATGTWKWMPGSSGGTAWAQSMEDISGWRSWLQNRMDPSADVIVDFGGGTPPLAPPVTE